MSIYKRSILAIMIFIPSLFLDRLTKHWAQSVLLGKYSGSLGFIDGIVGFKYAQNTGVAFSSLSGNTVPLIVLTGLILVVMIVCLLRLKDPSLFSCVCLSLMISGGAGNLWDRIAQGYVTDFINLEFMRFAIFNVADMLICVGAFAFAVSLIIDERRNRHAD